MVSIRFISDSTFYKKLGVENLLAYLKSLKHPLLVDIQSLLEKQTEISDELADTIQKLFYSEDNPHIDADAANLSDIGNLASDSGSAKLEQFYKNNQSIQKILSNDNLNNYDIAFQVFLKHRKEFNSVINNIHIERTSNWQFYSSKIKPELKKIDDIEPIKSSLLKAIQEKLEIKNLSIEINKEDKQRWLACLKYPDKLRVKERYSKKHELGIVSERKPLRMFLIFFPEEGSIKVHNDSISENINKALCEEFSKAFLSNAESYVQSLLPYSFELGTFKQIENISDTTTFQHSSVIKNISFDSVEFKPRESSVEIIRIKGFNDIRLSDLFERHSSYSLGEADIQEVKIRFRFTGQGSRERMLRITKTNGINLKASETRDEIMRHCLIKWGVLNVS